MYIQYFSIKMQQKLTKGLLNNNYFKVAKWFLKFCSKENTIVKIELSNIDIEKIFNASLFYKGELTSENNCTFEELMLEDILDWNIFIPYQVSKMQLGHPIILKRKLTHDNLHNVIYCFKGTLKTINTLLEYNSLPWTTKALRTDEENKIISSMKNRKDLHYYELGRLLYDDFDYEIIDRIYNLETMEELLHDFEIIASFNSDYQFIVDLLQAKVIEFTEQTEQDVNSYIEDYLEDY